MPFSFCAEPDCDEWLKHICFYLDRKHRMICACTAMKCTITNVTQLSTKHLSSPCNLYFYPILPPAFTHYLFNDGRQPSESDAMVIFACDDGTAQFYDQATCELQLTAIGERGLLLFAKCAALFVGRLCDFALLVKKTDMVCKR